MPSQQQSFSSKKNKSAPKKPLTFEQEILLAAITGKSREFLLAHPEFQPNANQRKKFQIACQKLRTKIPLAYILGYQWFYGRKFIVSKDVLIPRPETEQLVELAVDFCKKSKPNLVIDVGTGSGAIIASIAAGNQGKFFGIDVSAKALQVAKKNCHGLNIKLFRGDLLSPLVKKLQGASTVLITANLPYLSKKELAEPSIKKEPRLALYGGEPSHLLIEKLLSQISKLELSRALILLEFNYNQGATIKKLAKKYLPGASCEIKKDLSGFDRIAVIKIN